MDMEFSYAKNEWYVSANWWHCWCEIMHFMTKGVKKKSCTFVICVSFYTNNKRSHMFRTFKHHLLHVTVCFTFNKHHNEWSVQSFIGPPSASITSRHLFSILLIKVCMRSWSRMAQALSAKCAAIHAKRYRPSPSCWLSAWCYPRGSRWGCSRGMLQDREPLGLRHIFFFRLQIFFSPKISIIMG